jgi:hypothetical protein
MPRPTVRPAPIQTGHLITGVRATYYCLTGISRCTRNHPGGYYAAISPDLSFLRGKTITVSYEGRSVRVTVIDCDCQAHHAIDLYSDAFRVLAPLSRGVLSVTIRY